MALLVAVFAAGLPCRHALSVCARSGHALVRSLAASIRGVGIDDRLPS